MVTPGEQATADEEQAPLFRAERVNTLFLAPRQRKEFLLPQVNDLALEGRSCREISKILGVDKTTVHRWLQELRGEGRRKVADAGEMIAVAVARYDAIYREAMEAWRRSKVDKHVRLVEESEANGSVRGPKRKESLRTEGRAGDVAFLAEAKGAVNAICKLLPREALRWSKAAEQVP